MLFNGKKTKVKKGDRIVWERGTSCIRIVRVDTDGSNESLRWETSSGTDKKAFFHPIKTDHDLLNLVMLVAQMLSLRYKKCDGRPEYAIYELI